MALPGQTTGVRPGIRHLDEVVVPFLLDAQYFLDLRLGLQQEVLWRAAAEDPNRALAARAFASSTMAAVSATSTAGLILGASSGRAVQIAEMFIPAWSRPDSARRSARRTRSTSQNARLKASFTGRLEGVSAEPIMQLRRGHFLAELLGQQGTIQPIVGFQEHLLLKEHVVDADDPRLRSSRS